MIIPILQLGKRLVAQLTLPGPQGKTVGEHSLVQHRLGVSPQCLLLQLPWPSLMTQIKSLVSLTHRPPSLSGWDGCLSFY